MPYIPPTLPRPVGMRHALVALVILFVMSGPSWTRAAGAQTGPLPRPVFTIVRVTVPPLIKLVTDPDRVGPDGRPVVLVVSNIPELRGEWPADQGTAATRGMTVRTTRGGRG